MTIDRRLLAIAVLALPMMACTPNDINMGAAVKHNIALQVENPEPVYTDPAVTSGSTAASATERYRKGTVKKPVGQRSTQGSGGGGSGGSGSN
jgi:type IV pilus biogenesis protein CpaD/CtpE